MKLFYSEYFRNIPIKMIIYLKLSSMFWIPQQSSSIPMYSLLNLTNPNNKKHQNTSTHGNTKTPKHKTMFINEEQRAALVEKTQQYFKQVVTLTLPIMLTAQGLSSTKVFPGKKDYASSSLWRRRKLTNSVRTIGIWAHLGASGETFASETRSSEFIL